MERERIRLILESLSRVERILSTKADIGDVEKFYLSKNVSVTVYNFREFKDIRDIDGLGALCNIKRHYIINNRLHGNSGSLLFFTGDFRFAIKTIRNGELRCMRKIIRGYRTHLLENPKSFLCRILGCYSISDGEDTECFIVMKNILKSLKASEVYDLKGAYVRRRGCATSSLKDVDWVNNNKVVSIKEDKDAVIAQMREDVGFLRRCGIMDYSLLICFPSEGGGRECVLLDPPGSTDVKQADKYISDQEDVYFGIIDILTQWTLPKMLERVFNVFCCRSHSSCVDPDAYMNRFLGMIESDFFK